MSQVDAALLERVRRRLSSTGDTPSPARVAAALREEGGPLAGDEQLIAVLRTLQDEITGAGPLEPLLRDHAVTDVLVNAFDEVWVDRGAGLERTAVRFADDNAVRRLAQRLAAPSGRRLDDAQPWVDVRLGDGTRLHAVLPPISPRGVTLSLRVFRSSAFSLDDLVTLGSISKDGAALLRAIVVARLAFLVTGGTGTGKTTLLATLLGLVDPGERIVLVEDAGELRPEHPHVVRLESRPANLEGAGAVALRDLVRQALRMRPDRIVVGEVRGAEVTELLAALNTGHEGGCGTVHANSASEVPARLEALAALAGMRREALHSQLAAAVQGVIHLRRRADGRREVAQVHLLQPGRDGLVVAVPAALLDGGLLRPGPAMSGLEAVLASRDVVWRGPTPCGPTPCGPTPCGPTP